MTTDNRPVNQTDTGDTKQINQTDSPAGDTKQINQTDTPAGDLPERSKIPLYTYRFRYARREPAIWLAHLDMMRTFERSIRRAGWPVAWSLGYNPRPQMTFALPISVGLATEDDYFDVLLKENLKPSFLLKTLNSSLPRGFEVTAAGRLLTAGASLMSLVTAAEYALVHPSLQLAWEKMAALPADQPLMVAKKSKKKMRQVDVRPLIIKAEWMNETGLLLKTLAGSQTNLRPDLFLQALTRYGALDPLDAASTVVIRKKLWIKTENGKDLISPIETAQDVVFLKDL